jgi:hypothetical protein
VKREPTASEQLMDLFEFQQEMQRVATMEAKDHERETQSDKVSH